MTMIFEHNQDSAKMSQQTKYRS